MCSGGAFSVTESSTRCRQQNERVHALTRQQHSLRDHTPPSHLLQPLPDIKSRHRALVSLSLSPLCEKTTRDNSSTFFPSLFLCSTCTLRDYASSWRCIETPAASCGVQTHPHCTAHPEPREKQHGTWIGTQELGAQGHRIFYAVLSAVIQNGDP